MDVRAPGFSLMPTAELGGWELASAGKRPKTVTPATVAEVVRTSRFILKLFKSIIAFSGRLHDTIRFGPAVLLETVSNRNWLVLKLLSFALAIRSPGGM